MPPPLFSVIIPSYNRAALLQRAIDSVVRQSWPEWELIVVDDGSTDNTSEMLMTLDDPRIRTVRIAHSERSRARNAGKDMATGQYLCFLDSDDFFLPHHLSQLAATISSSPGFSFFRTGAWLYSEGSDAVLCEMTPREPLESFPFECIQTFAFRRSEVVSLQFDQRFIVGEDLHFMLRATAAASVCIVRAATVVYNRPPRNIRRNYRQEAVYIREKLRCLDDILQWNQYAILSYLRRQRCLSSLHLLRLSVAVPSVLVSAVLQNFRSLSRFPVVYVLVLLQGLSRSVSSLVLPGK